MRYAVINRRAPYGAKDESITLTADTADHAWVPEPRTFTGLYDQNGHELHRLPEPIGFDLHRGKR